MESWADICVLVDMTDKYMLPNTYFREMRCLLVKQGGLDLFVKCSKTFPNNSDLIESMMRCMENVVHEEESRHEMMRQDIVQEVLAIVNSKDTHSCWLAINILATMMNDGADMWQKTKTDFQVPLAKMDEIYDIWTISSLFLGFRRSTFQDMSKLVESNVPQLQHHALWSLAYFTRKENSKTSIFHPFRLTIICIVFLSSITNQFYRRQFSRGLILFQIYMGQLSFFNRC